MATALYVTPSDVQQLLPLGVNFSSLGGPGASADLNAASIIQCCHAATRQLNGITGQSLQAGIRNEAAWGPGHRIGILPSGVARFLASTSPIYQILLVQVAYSGPTGNPATFTWTTVPPGASYAEYTQSADDALTNTVGTAAPGSNAILITGGYVNWCNGRMGEYVRVGYVNGWPNSSISAPATAGAMSIQVDDVSGWSGGIADVTIGGVATAYVGAEIYDGMTTEGVLVSGVTGYTYTDTTTGAPVGPGTLNLLTPLQYPHNPTSFNPLLVSSLPHTVRWAAGLLVKAIALRQGATVITGPSGKTSSKGGSLEAIQDAQAEAHLILETYRRTSF